MVVCVRARGLRPPGRASRASPWPSPGRLRPAGRASRATSVSMARPKSGRTPGAGAVGPVVLVAGPGPGQVGADPCEKTKRNESTLGLPLENRRFRPGVFIKPTMEERRGGQLSETFTVGMPNAGSHWLS